MIGRPTKGGVRNLFTGLLVCGYCGSRMQYVNKGDNSKSVVCATAMRGLGCQYVGYPYDELETTFLRFCEEIDLSTIQEGNPSDDLIFAIQQAEGQLMEIDRQLQRLAEALGTDSTGEAPASVIRRLSELELLRVKKLEELKGLRERLGSNQSTSRRIETLRDLLEKIQQADSEDSDRLRRLVSEQIRSVVTEITLFPANRNAGTFEPNAVQDRKTRKQRRHYFVHFRNEDGFRLVFSRRGVQDVPASVRRLVTSEEWKQMLASRKPQAAQS